MFIFMIARHTSPFSHLRQKQRGFTLIELVIFIMLVSTAIVGVLNVMQISSRESGDPLIQKQALSIAQGLMQEITNKSFTYCDPDDANGFYNPNQPDPTNVADPTKSKMKLTPPVKCDQVLQADGSARSPDAPALGPDLQDGVLESRYASDRQFDEIKDYHNFTLNAATNGYRDPSNTPVIGLKNYIVRVLIERPTADWNSIPLNDVLHVRVRVGHASFCTEAEVADGTKPLAPPCIEIDTYRTRYAPYVPNIGA